MDFSRIFLFCNNAHLAKRLHAQLISSGEFRNVFFSTKLINLFGDLGDIRSTRMVFDQIPNKNIFTWNSMLSSYVRNGVLSEAIDCYYELLSTHVRPDFFTFPVVLKACGTLDDGMKVHCRVLKSGLGLDFFIASSLINMYTRVGVVADAKKVFDETPVRDRGSWNAMISGFCQNGEAYEALKIFRKMKKDGVTVDSITVSSVLPICAPLDDIFFGKLIHGDAIKLGLGFDLFVSNALINMYSKLDHTESARAIFDEMTRKDLVSWNSIISTYEQIGDPIIALLFFNQMKENDILPDALTLVSLASVMAQSGDYQNARSVHGFVVRMGWIFEDIFIGNAIIDMYANLGKMDIAHKVFDLMTFKDGISWNTMIKGCAQNGLASEAVEIYDRMKNSEQSTTDQGTLVSILLVYSHLGWVRQGMIIHSRSICVGLQSDIFVGTCLIDMYAKCGQLDDAMIMFNEIPRKSSIPWNAIISGHGIHGHAEKALNLFKNMQEEKVKPDHITFVSLLSACSHSGLVSQGQECFLVMKQKYGIEPTLKHYSSMVDLFGRAGQLDKAYEFIKAMPIKPDASVWGALLGACRIHGNVELGKVASDCLFQIDSENVGYYVLLSNIYANVGKWEGVDKMRSLVINKGLKKTPGWSSVEVDNKVDVFYTGNRSHPRLKEIYGELRSLLSRMKGLGYVPDYSFVLQDVEEDEKEHILMSHSERLAMAFGIISTPLKTTIRIFKNLRVCGDCHNATKFISIITEREIIVRDSNRFHHFKTGKCSCGDFW